VPFPHHARKHREPSLFSASDSHRYETSGRARRHLAPKTVLLVFGARWRGYLARRYGPSFGPFEGLHRASDDVGVALLRGPGAPYAAMMVEELGPLGAGRFVIVGLAGSLQPDLRVGSWVVCDRALRDEGTSHHYVRPATFVRPSAPLVTKLKRALGDRGIPYAQGTTWTTDAPYRETVAEVRRYRRAGFLTVEMEASAVFSVARYLGKEAAALFVISDHLDESGWEPRFRDSQSSLRQALAFAVEALTSGPSERASMTKPG
jgi:uridine phosphorylase